jgi:hypothetical protein
MKLESVPIGRSVAAESRQLARHAKGRNAASLNARIYSLGISALGVNRDNRVELIEDSVRVAFGTFSFRGIE